VWFLDLGGILDICCVVDSGVCDVVDVGLPPQASSAVEAFSCGGMPPLRSRIPWRLLGACRFCAIGEFFFMIG
jgi:hypothetical protein